jgi:hypothetical protein
MSSAGRTGKRWYGWAFLSGGVLAALVACAGCRRPVVTKPVAVTATAAAADEALDSASEALLKQTDLASCRAAVQQLNVHLGRNPEQRRQLDDKDKERLQGHLGLDKDELAELNSATFTPLDGYYLERCFLLRDAARALDIDHLPPVAQAEAAFAWVMRQVRLEERDGARIPEPFILRRGRGTSQERALIVLGVLDQLGIDGALVAFPRPNQGGTRRWMAGALIGKDVYLFDSHLGLPLPGPDGKPATLAQLRADGDVFRRLGANPKYPYDLTPEQAKEAEIYFTCPLSALAPRMKTLEAVLSAHNRVSLTCDLFARMDKFRAAVGLAVPVRTWDSPGDATAPLRTLRQFLRPGDGGSDTQRVPLVLLRGYAAPSDRAPLGLPRKEFFEHELVPWTYLPEQIRQIPFGVDLGMNSRLFFKNSFSEFYLNPDQPRNFLLRGQLDEATRLLVTMRDLMGQARDVVRAHPELETQVNDWCRHAIQVQAEYLRAKNNAARDPAAFERARAGIEAMWKAGQKPLGLLLSKASAEPLSAEIDYCLALCTQEQAERLEAARRRSGAADSAAARAAQEAWKTADGWWVTFEQEHPDAPALAAARTLHARACVALGDPQRAAALMENLSGRLTDLEKTARLYRAQQLKPAKKAEPRP